MRRLPRPAGRPAPRRLLAAVLGVMLVTGPVPGVAQVPEPPLVVDVDDRDGQVHLSPATQTVPDGHATWVLTNGGEDRLTFDLAVHAVDTTPEGVEIGDRLDIPLGLDSLALGPSEAARIPLQVGDQAPAALALVATTEGAEPATTVAALALVGDGDSVAPDVGDADASRGVFSVRLDADDPALVDVALRASAWFGAVQASQVVEGVYVPAGGRDLEVSVDGPLLGRVTVDVVVAGAETTRASSTVWWWPARLLLAVLGLVLLAAVAVVVLRRRRRGA